MRYLIFFLLTIIFTACSSISPSYKTNPLQTTINQQIAKNLHYIKRCFPRNYDKKKIILYMNINSLGVISNITILPLTSRMIEQCVSMALSRLRLPHQGSKAYKVRKVLRF